MSRARDLADYVSTGVTSTEFDKLDGLTATTDELNLVDGSVSGPLSHRNMVINGNFDVWQRGDSFSASTTPQYTSDRWYVQQSGATVGVSRQTFTVGQTDVPGNPKYYLRYNVTVGNDNARLTTQIEGVNTFAGQTVTLSYWAKHQSGTLPTTGLTTQLRQDFGYGGSPSSTVYISSGTNITLTSSWQQFTQTFNVPSISGKTIGTDLDYLGVALLWQNGNDTSAYTIDIAQVQLELGSVATPFESRNYAEELARCQRYTYVTGTNASASYSKIGIGTNATTTACFVNIFFPTSMRTNPDLTLSSSTASDYGLYHQGDLTCDAVPTLNTNSTEAVGASTWSVASGLSGGGCSVAQENNGTNVYLIWDAEII